MRRRPGMIMLHLDSVEAGLRFPLHSFYVEFFHCFQVAPAQFMPNSYRFISAFLVRCKLAGTTATLDLFHYFYRITPQNSDGYLSVAARPGRRLFKSYPSSIHDWKNRFFFLRYDSPPLPVRWNGYPPKIESLELTDDLSGDVEKVLQGGICPIAGPRLPDPRGPLRGRHRYRPVPGLFPPFDVRLGASGGPVLRGECPVPFSVRLLTLYCFMQVLHQTKPR
ncbi:unnamed protein product [Cuscuta epithymum]|uniref:Transposase (putative) gypsy type domain-containing protein n=1 Tax=Cuscuta epithymum TaxID=186058 RepID=A0AAV0FW55_9ASTE|nr:unnamed protein product [Cuscuta epithymum]